MGFLIGQVAEMSGMRVAIPHAGLIVGRDPGEAQLVVDHPLLSRRHAQIAVGADRKPCLIDLQSRNGTFVNGRRIDAPVLLSPNDKIEFGAEGEVVFLFESAGTTSVTGVLNQAFGEHFAPVDWQPGDVILNRYEVKSALGEGGMGRVYLVHHKHWNVDLAVKSPKPGLFSEEKAVENFIREAETWVNLDLHPNIVQCHYVRAIGGIPRIFAEYVPGGSLAEWIAHRKFTGVDQMLDVAIQFAWGLHAAHEQGLVHQDVKPLNVLMTPDGTAKVSDFGLTRAKRTVNGNVATGTDNLATMAGVFTLAFCSPEQARGERLARKTDIWNRGLVLWRSCQIADDALLREMEESRQSHKGDMIVPCLLAQIHLERGDSAAALDMLRAAGKDDKIASADVRALRSESECRLKYSMGRTRRLNEALHGYLDEICISSDGRWVVVGKNTGELKLWDLQKRCCFWVVEADPSGVTSVCIAKDNSVVLSGGNDGLVRLWDMTSGRHIADMFGHNGAVSEIYGDNSSRWAISVSRDKTLRVWDVSESCCSHVLAHDVEVHVGGGFNSTGDRFALCSSSEIHLWDTATWKRIGLIKTGDVVCMSWLPNSATVLTGGIGFHFWDSERGACNRILHVHRNVVTCVRVTGSGESCLSSSSGGSIRYWDLQTGRCLYTISKSSGWFTSSANGRRIVSRDDEGFLRLWDFPTVPVEYRAPFHLNRPSDTLSIIAASREFNRELNLARTAFVRADFVTTAKLLRKARGHSGYSRHAGAFGQWAEMYLRLPRVGLAGAWESGTIKATDVSCLKVLHGQHHAVTGHYDGTVRIWDLVSKQAIRSYQAHVNKHKGDRFFGVTAIALSGDSTRLLTSGGDDYVRLWDLRTGDCCVELNCGDSESVNLIVSSGSRFAVVVSKGKEVFLWDVERPRMLRRLGNIFDSWVAMSPDESKLLFSKPSGLSLVDLATGGEIAAMKRVNFNSVCWSERVRYAFGSGYLGAGIISLDNKETSLLAIPVDEDLWGSWSVCALPCGRFFFSGGPDGVIRIWDTAERRCVRELKGHRGSVDNLSVSRRGDFLVSEGDDHTMRIWSLDWELEDREPSDWDDGARPHLETFLTLHTPFARGLPTDRQPNEGEVTLALTRRGKPIWNEEDFQRLLFELGCAGYGWVRPEAVRQELERMASARL